MLDGLVGVICSRKEKKVYCLEQSTILVKDYETMRKRRDLRVIYIPAYRLNELIAKDTDVSLWEFGKILRLKVTERYYSLKKAKERKEREKKNNLL